MAKKKISRKHNTPIYIYDLGGKIASVGGAASSIIGTGISNARIADTSDIENQIDNAKSYIVGANDNESLMNEWGTWTPMDRINWRDIRGLDAGQGISNTLGATVSGASAGATVGGPIGAIVGGAAGLISGITGALVGDAKAKRKAEELNKQIKIANTRGLLSLEEKARNIDAQNDLLALANYTANGGRIYIKPQNRGKFTEYCGGKVTSECIAKGKRSSDPAVRKRATFADNARKWKHDDGGPLNPYSAGALVDAIYSTFKREKYLDKPSHNYDFTILEEEANKLGYYPDERGHRDDRVKKSTHPTHPSRGKWKSFEEFELTDRGMENPNYTLFGLNDGGQDPQAVMTYNGGVVLPEITVTPKKSYIMNPYDNIKIFNDGGFMENYVNPSTVTGAIAKGALQVLDPSGISSYPDVYYSGKEFFNNPSWENAEVFGLNVIGALPLMGKVTAPFKAAKIAKLMSRIEDASTIIKAADKVRDVNKIIDTLPELIPITRNAAEKTQDITTSLISDPLFQLIKPDNKLDAMRAFRASNAAVDVTNAANSAADIVGIVRDIKNSNKKSEGGPLTHGGIFSNGVAYIGNGGTHEQNPFDGVQIGVDNQGIPNLVEEGEVIWNDYVFSNRLKPTQEFKDKYKVKGETFADIAKEMQKESEERPNDPISKSGLEDSMIKLQIEQENIRMKDNRKEYKNIFKEGGWQNKEMDAPSLIDTIKAITPGMPEKIITIPKDFTVSPESSDTNQNNHFARYAPIAGSALGVLENLFSKPDYSNANLILEAANQAGNYTPVGYTPIGNYLSYNPLDINYYTNKLAGQSSATRRAIINQSAGNRATATAGLLAADYNTQEKYGDLIRQAEEFNLAQRQAVEQFNRATNQANAEMGLQASRANQAARQAANEARLKGVAQAVALKEEQDKQRAASRSVNLTNLFDNIGALGKEEYIMDMIRKNPYLLYDWLDNYKGIENSCGGQLTIKKKKGRK